MCKKMRKTDHASLYTSSYTHSFLASLWFAVLCHGRRLSPILLLLFNTLIGNFLNSSFKHSLHLHVSLLSNMGGMVFRVRK